MFDKPTEVRHIQLVKNVFGGEGRAHFGVCVGYESKGLCEVAVLHVESCIPSQCYGSAA